MASKKQLNKFLSKKSKPRKTNVVNIGSRAKLLGQEVFGTDHKKKTFQSRTPKAKINLQKLKSNDLKLNTNISKSAQKKIKSKLKRVKKLNEYKPEKEKKIKKQRVKKSDLNKKIRRTYNYYKKQLKPLVETFMSATSTSDVERNQIVKIINESMEVINLTLRANKETLDFGSEVSETLKDVKKFLKDLESVGWSTGRYLNKFGFHHLFLPEDVWYELSSIKLEQALEFTNEYIQELVDYGQGDTPSALDNQEHKIRRRRDNGK